jgi:NADH-quinone oxidoreductase subunit B
MEVRRRHQEEEERMRQRLKEWEATVEKRQLEKIGAAPQPQQFTNLYSRLGHNVLLTTTDTLFSWARKSSLWPMQFGIACCAIEMIATYMAHHDFDRFGVVTWPSPRQSDVMIVAGTVNYKMAEVVKRLYEQMPNPKWVISMGVCATSGGPFYRYPNVVLGVDEVIPVDVYVSGCPPRPEALLHGLITLQEKIMREGREGRWRGRAPKVIESELLDKQPMLSIEKPAPERARDLAEQLTEVKS